MFPYEVLTINWRFGPAKIEPIFAIFNPIKMGISILLNI